jgi:hypothetical protein
MADPTAILCQGTTMTFNSVAVGGLMSISGIGSGSATEIDITTFASTAKEFTQGLRDFGSISVELRRNQDDLGQVEMFTAMASQLTRTVVITLPTSTANVATFTAFVQSLSTDLKADGAVTGTAVLRITGAVAWT